MPPKKAKLCFGSLCVGITNLKGACVCEREEKSNCKKKGWEHIEVSEPGVPFTCRDSQKEIELQRSPS